LSYASRPESPDDASSPPIPRGSPRAGDAGPMSEGPRGVRVPLEQLGPETLRGVVESFVHREGTDYGRQEASLQRKVADVMGQLERGEGVLLFDPEDESINIVPRDAASD